MSVFANHCIEKEILRPQGKGSVYFMLVLPRAETVIFHLILIVLSVFELTLPIDQFLTNIIILIHLDEKKLLLSKMTETTESCPHFQSFINRKGKKLT